MRSAKASVVGAISLLLAQTTLRAVLGKHELDNLLSERERLNLDVQKILEAQTAS